MSHAEIDAEKITDAIMSLRGWTIEEFRKAQIGKLAEETGEAIKEANRYVGNSRYPSHVDETRVNTLYELADVVITAYVMARAFDADLDDYIADKSQKIRDRGGF